MDRLTTNPAATGRSAIQTIQFYFTSLPTRIKTAIIKVGTWLSWAGFSL
jgi:hypothetical protein